MNYLGLAVIILVAVAFAAYCIDDVMKKRNEKKADDNFARLENRSPGMTDVDK